MMILSAYKNRLDEMDFRKVSSILFKKMTVAGIHSVDSNFFDVVYLKWCIPHLNIFVNFW